MGFHLSDEKVNLWGGLDALCHSQRWPMFCSPGKEMAWRFWKPQKQASSRPKKATVVFFSAQKNESLQELFKNMKNIWISKKRRLGCFFQPPRDQKVIHHDPSPQKISKKNPSKMQVKISSSARFGVLVLCSWPQSFVRIFFCPHGSWVLPATAPRPSSSPCCWWKPCVTPSASLVSGLFHQNFGQKNGGVREIDWHFLVLLNEEKDYKVAKMGPRDSFAEELYLVLGDIFNMVESFEWKFQSCFKSSEMLKMNLRLLTVLKVNETLSKGGHLLARVFYDLTRDMILLCCPFAGST